MDPKNIYQKESQKCHEKIDYWFSNLDLLNRLTKFYVEKVLSKDSNLTTEQIYEFCDKILFVLKLSNDKIRECNEICLKHRQIWDLSVEILDDLANIDSLTRLFNSKSFKEKWLELLKNEKIFNVILIDIDNFKQINDNLWHNIWDQILVEFSKILKDIFSNESTFVYRLSWDEFTILSTEKKDQLERQIEILKQLFHNRLKNYFKNKEYEKFIIKLWISYWISSSNEKWINKRNKNNFKDIISNINISKKIWIFDNVLVDKLRWLVWLADIRMYETKKINKNEL